MGDGTEVVVFGVRGQFIIGRLPCGCALRLPQNANPAWQQALGDDWQAIHNRCERGDRIARARPSRRSSDCAGQPLRTSSR